MSVESLGKAAAASVARARRPIEALAAFMSGCAGWAYIVAAAFISVDVTCRKFFGFNSGATTEISGYLLGFGITWGLAHAMVERAHIRIDMLVMRMPLGLRQFLHVGALLLLVALVAIVGWSATTVIEETRLFNAHDLSSLAIPLLWPQILWTFGIGVFALLLVSLLVECLCRIAAGDAAGIDALLRPRGSEEETKETLDALEEAAKP